MSKDAAQSHYHDRGSADPNDCGDHQDRHGFRRIALRTQSF